MDPIMIGIAAVVILVILAGVFFMKKGKTSADSPSQSHVKRPKTLAEQQRELELQRQSQHPTPTTANSLPQSTLQNVPTVNDSQSAHNELQAAEQLIQAQDYQGAITILRRAVKNHPTHNNLHFALLNSYALAKDYQSFNALYPDVLARNDFNLTTQANNLKTLLDEEQAMSAGSMATASVANSKPAETDELDFELFDVKQAANEPTTPAALAPVTTKASSQMAATTSQFNDQTDNALDFDFSLDTLDTKPAITNTTVSESPVSKAPVSKAPVDALSFDTFDFDLPNDQVATVKKETASHTEIFAPVSTTATESVESSAIAVDNDFDFDFELPATQSTPVTSATSATPAMQPVIDATTTTVTKASPEDDLAFDFDFELDTRPTPPSASTTTDLASEKSSDIDLTLASLDTEDFTKSSSDAAATSTSVTDTPTARSDEIDLSALALADELLLQADATATAPAHLAPVTTAAVQPVTAMPAVQTSTPSATLAVDEMFDFGLDDEAATPDSSITSVTDTQPAAIDDKIDVSFDEPATTQTASSVATPVVEDLSALFEVVKDIDTDALTVDLAEQYVSLGEYDSAKRLLDEIKDSGNAALLARADALRQRIA